MNENIVEELKNTIENLKKEISQKQEELNSLIEQYQELSGIELYDDEMSIELENENE